MASTLYLSSGQVIAYHMSCVHPHSPIIVLANPLAAPFTFWDPLVSVFCAAGYSVLRYNQPGHGDSTVVDVSKTTFSSIATDVKELLDLLQIKKVHAWIGVSMGAATGVVFTTKYPGFVKKLVICDTIERSPVVAGAANPFPARVQAARDAGSLDATVAGTMDRWFGKSWLSANVDEAERLKKAMLTTTIDGYAACCAALSSETFNLPALYSDVGKSVEEVLLLRGGDDADVKDGMENMRAKIEESLNGKKVKLTVVEKAGHVLFVDGRDGFLAAVKPFLEA